MPDKDTTSMRLGGILNKHIPGCFQESCKMCLRQHQQGLRGSPCQVASETKWQLLVETTQKVLIPTNIVSV